MDYLYGCLNWLSNKYVFLVSDALEKRLLNLKVTDKQYIKIAFVYIFDCNRVNFPTITCSKTAHVNT